MDAKAETPGDRDELGRFVPGHTVRSPGRPTSEVSAKVRAAIELAVSNGSLEKWARAVKGRIEKGDLDAAEFVFDRILGRPKQSMEIEAEVGVKLYGVVSPDDWPA